jgi:small-conductance mechanosensitive channel
MDHQKLITCCKKILAGNYDAESWLDFLQIGVESKNRELEGKALEVAPEAVDMKLKEFIQAQLERNYELQLKLRKLEEKNLLLEQQLSKVKGQIGFEDGKPYREETSDEDF